MELSTFTLRLSMALVLGIAVGIERQWRQKSAGLRTNALVALGAAAFVLLSVKIGGDASSRIASYIVSGIGFLGAGVIMKDGMNVQGINTAATIWCSAALGSLCGIGLYSEASILALSIIIAHVVLRPLGMLLGRINFIPSVEEQTDYVIALTCNGETANTVRVALMRMLGNEEKLLLKSLTSSDADILSNVRIQAVIKSATRQDGLIERLASRLTIEENVMKVSWEITGMQSDM